MSWSEGRWYYASGEHCAEIDGHAPTLRDARKYDLIASTTTKLSIIAKPGLVAWADKLTPGEAEKARDTGAEYGKACHAAIAELIRGEGATANTADGVSAAVASCQAFLEASRFNIDLVEHSFARVDEGYAGTCDLVCFGQDERPIVIDWKFGSYVDVKSWHWQLAAYAHGLGLDGAVLLPVQVRPEGTTPYPYKGEYEDALAGFRAAAYLWNHWNSFWPAMVTV